MSFLFSRPAGRRLGALALLILVAACGGASDEGPPTPPENLATASQGLALTDAMPAAGARVVGSTLGQLNVSRIGQATYAMPIVVAPGPGGMQPTLGVDYASDGADGVLGPGFSLAGFSTIVRCPRTIAQDGAPGGLRWTAEDRFCLDGQRLVAVSGAYGADGTEYRTEVESFTKVISRGSSPGGPASFDVWTRDGRVMQYGGTEDSRVERWQRPEAHRWLVNRVSDRAGNGYDVSYHEHNGSGAAVPTAIWSFGANGQRSGQSVQFLYDSRPDVKTVFQSGSFFRPHLRLRKAITRDGAAVVRDYAFAYDAGGSGGRSRLTSMTECGSDGVCLAPTTFTWSTPDFHFERRYFGGGGQGGLVAGDFDGDGRGDLFTWWGGATQGYWNLSNGTSFAGWTSVVSDLPPQRMPVVADFDGDGKSDLVTVDRDGALLVWRSSGASFGAREVWSRRADIFGALAVADFDGDGKADLAELQRGAVVVYRSTGSGFEGPTTWASTSGEVAFGDMDGDGRSDLVEVRGDQAFVRTAVPGGFAPERLWGPLLPGAKQYSDVNGDGTTDVVVRDAAGVSHVYWSSGEGLVYTQPYADTLPGDALIDLNGDGKADLLGFADGQIRVGLAQASGIGFDRVSALSQAFGAFEGPEKVFRNDTRTLTPSGAWLSTGGDFPSEAVACRDLGYPVAGATFECGKRAGNVDGVVATQTYEEHGEAGGFASCANTPTAYRTDGSSSTPWSPAMDYTQQPTNCRPECTAWSGGEAGDFCVAWGGQVCDTTWCNVGGCSPAPPPPSAWLEPVQSRSYGVWAAPHGAQAHDHRCEGTVPVGSDCGGTGYSAYTGMARALHCVAPAKPLPLDVNGDGKLDVVEVDPAGSIWVDVAVGTEDRVVRIEDGLGQQHEIDYRPVAVGTGVYSRGSELSASPLGKGIDVVSQVRSSDGLGGKRAVSYAYEGGSIDTTGRGFAGFQKVTATDGSTGIVSVKAYHVRFPLTGQLAWEQTLASGVVVGSTVHVTEASPIAPFVVTRTRSEEAVSELDRTTVRFTRTSYGGHAYGFPGKVTVEISAAPGDTSEVVTSTTTNSYTHDAATWTLGRLLRASVTKTRTGAPASTRTSAFTYDARGLLVSETVEPDSAALATKTTHELDVFGNRIASTETSGGLSRRITRAFDAWGRFVVRETNALGQVTSYVRDGRSGEIVKATDPNGLVTTFALDAMAHKVGVQSPDGQIELTYLEAPSAGDPSSAAMVVRTVRSSSGTTREVRDVLGRVIRTSTPGWAGKVVNVDTAWSPSGLKIATSRPYFAGEVRNDFTFSYDALGRETLAVAPDGGRTTFVHRGRVVTETDARGSIKTKSETLDGKLAAVVEVVGGRPLVLEHRYDAEGQLVTSIDPIGVTTTIAYDLRGRRTSITEPNAGRRTFTVDGFGRVRAELDARGVRIEHTYDLIDRETRRLELDAARATLRDVTWVYDRAWIGKLASAETREPVLGILAQKTRRQLAYDGLGREIAETRTVDGTPMRTARSWDAATGRLASVTYPGILRTAGQALHNEYDAVGALVAVRRDTATGPVVWRAEELDAAGSVVRERLENGLVTTRTYDPVMGQLRRIATPRKDGMVCAPAACVPEAATLDPVTRRDAKGCGLDASANRYQRLPAGCAGETPQDLAITMDADGNITSRRDAVMGVEETFTFDELDRLRTVSGPAPKTLSYDDAGNILTKSDIGTYVYGAAKAHLVQSVKRSGVVVTKYTYDAAGNVLTGAGRTYAWTAFGKASRVDAGASFVELGYDDGNVLASTRGSGGNTVLHGESFELETRADGTRERRTFVRVGGLVRAVFKSLAAPGATAETNGGSAFFLHDHLGSTSVVTDSNGAVVQRLSYDAHGKRRFTTGLDDTTGLLGPASTSRTFTDHLGLEDVGLVYMNARLYDPLLGRFLSADTEIQSAEEVNGLHRYAYGGNNAISVIDPSGHGFFKSLWRVVKTFLRVVVAVVVTVVVAIIVPEVLPAVIASWEPIVIGAVSGAIVGAINGGAKGALIGALTGGVFGAVGGIDFAGELGNDLLGAVAKASVHGTVSGLASVAQGGDFVHGFVAGFANGMIGPITAASDDVFVRTLTAAAIGGAASKLAGGSFENGAVSAAFAQLWNDSNHPSGISPARRSELQDLAERIHRWLGPSTMHPQYDRLGQQDGVRFTARGAEADGSRRQFQMHSLGTTDSHAHIQRIMPPDARGNQAVQGIGPNNGHIYQEGAGPRGDTSRREPWNRQMTVNQLMRLGWQGAILRFWRE